MKVKINDQEYNLPVSLAAVTLSQRIEFDKVYGKGQREDLKKILAIKDDWQKEMAFTDYHLKLAYESLIFFAGVPPDIMNNTAIDDVLPLYHTIMKGYAEDQDFTNKEFELKHEFAWKDSIWTIAAPELKSDSKMTFGEFITSKQVVQNMMDLGDEKWGALLPLCCIFFRKKDEPFNEDFVNEGSERYELMKSLPLEFALHVAFFLSASQSFYLNTSQYSGKAEDQLAESS